VTKRTIKAAEVFQPAWSSEPRYIGLRGGRGSGKSHDRAADLVIRAAQKTLRWVCIREVQRSLDQSVKRLLEDKIEAYGLGSRFRVLENRIEGVQNGTHIIFQGMQNHTADSVKSLEGYDGAWIEEAQSLSQRSLDLLRPTIRKPGSQIWATWNPDKSTDPIDAFFADGGPPGSVVIEANYWHNPWFPGVLRAEMEWDRARDPDKYRHVWCGEYRQNTQAQVFKNWRIDRAEVPPDALPYYGADWGFSVDPTVLVLCWIWGRTLYIQHEAYKVGCEITDTPSLFDTVPGARKHVIRADSARPETISHMRRSGFPMIRKARKGAGSVEEGVNFLKDFDIIVDPQCRHAIDELGAYSYKIDPHTGDILPVLADKKNHVIDSLRYATEERRRASGKSAAALPQVLEVV
jgi:phage terminase large subunit